MNHPSSTSNSPPARCFRTSSYPLLHSRKDLHMTSRERVFAALNHSEPDRIPVDFGATPVTGIHVSVVAALRDHFGLDRHPVKVTEPYQMLGEIEPDLAAALAVDVIGVTPRKTMFGFANE